MIGEKFNAALSGKELLEMMQNVATKVEQREVYVPLSAEEVEAKRALLTDTMIKIDAEEVKFQLLKDEHKMVVKPLKAIVGSTLLEVRTGQELRKGVFYDMANSELGLMQTYDEQGVCVAERRLMPTERGNSMLFVPDGFKVGGSARTGSE